MCNCNEVKTIWIELKSFIFRKIQVNLDIDPRTIVFVYHKQDSFFFFFKYCISGNKNIFLTPLEKSAPPVRHSSKKIANSVHRAGIVIQY